MTKLLNILPHIHLAKYHLVPGLAAKITKRRKAISRLISNEFNAVRSIRVGNKFSRFVRIVLERVNIKALMGGNIAFMVLTTSLITQTNGNAFAQGEVETSVLPTTTVTLTTNINQRYPLEHIKLNQGYFYFHRGIDFGAPIGDPVYPIMKGKVIERDFSRFGYGNSVIVDHQNGLKSRYAHLSRIDVKDGEDVYTKQPLGLVGSTGRSTGPHLHLEIYQNEVNVNPLTILSGSKVKS